MNEKISSDRAEKENPNRNLIIGLGIVAGVIVLAICAIAVVFVLIDPFNIMARLTGRYDPIANAMPADTSIYMSIDFSKLMTEETNRIIDAFANAAEAVDFGDTGSLLEELEDSLEESFDLTFTDDVLPWIGQYVGLSFSDFDLGYVDEPSGDLIFLIEVRNRRKADEFLEKLVDNVRQEGDLEIDEIDYRGVTIFEHQGEYEFETFAIGRSENLLIYTTGIELLKDSVDAMKGDSLADTQEYDEFVNALPKDRAISFFINTKIFETFQGTYEELLPGFEEYQSQQLQMFRWMAGSFTTIESGIQMDFIVAYDEATISADQLSMLEEAYLGDGLAQFFPEETILYITGARLDLVWENLRESMLMTSDVSDFEESMDIFDDEFGFNPDQDLFPILDGQWSIGLLHTLDGYMAKELDIPLGLILLIESSENDELKDITEKISEGFEYSGIGEIHQYQSGDLTLYDFEDPYEEAVLFTFGAGEGYFLLSTDHDSLEDAFSRQTSLADNEKFVDAFPEEMRPVMFIDMSVIFDIIEDQLILTDDFGDIDGLEVLRPLTAISGASAPYEDGLVQTRILIFIEGE
jgi:hypothetical protein